VDAPIRALITLRDPGATILKDPSASTAVLTASPGLQAPVATIPLVGPCLEGPSPASAIADSPVREVRPAEPIAISSAVASVEPTAAPSAVASPSGGAIRVASATTVHSSEGTHSWEPIAPSLAIAASFSRQVRLFFVAILVFSRNACLTLFSFRTWIFRSSLRLTLPRSGQPYWRPMTLPQA
jgi:hypothetical protein